MDNVDFISTDNCDCCHRTATPGVVFHHFGAPVLFQCATCAPNNFEFQARRDIDRWLETGETVQLGR